MSMHRYIGTWLLVLTTFSFGWATNLRAEPAISGYELVSSKRVGRTLFEYEYRALSINDSEAIRNVTASVSSSNTATEIVEGDLRFPDMAAVEQARSIDTLTLRQDRRSAFDPSALNVQFQFEPVAPDPPTLQFEFDTNLVSEQTVGSTGGIVALDEPQGALLQLEFAPGSLPQDTTIRLQGLVDITNLPAGVRLITGARLQPSGVGFAGWPRLTADLRNLQAPGARVMGFLASDDGSEFILLPLVSTRQDPLPNPTLPLAVRVPHFSVVGFLEVIVGTAEPPPLSGSPTSAELALHTLAQQLDRWANNTAMGIDDPFFADGEAFGPLNLWINNPVDGLAARATNLANTADRNDLQPIRDFFFDLTFINFDIIPAVLKVESLEAILGGRLEELAREAMIGYLAAIRAGCPEDSLRAFDQTSQMGDLQFNSPFNLDVITGEQPCRIDLKMSPAEQAVLEGSAVSFDVTLTLEDGTIPDPAMFNLFNLPAPSGFTEDPALDERPDGSVLLDPVPLGFTEVSITPNKGTAAFADVIGIPDLTGVYGALAAGTASGCLDDEDQGFERFNGNYILNFQATASASSAAEVVNLNLSGVGSGAGVVLDMGLRLNQIEPGNVAGSLTRGTLTYDFIEVELDADGNEVQFRVIGNLDVSGTYENGGFILFGVGSDNFCQLVQGSIVLGQP